MGYCVEACCGMMIWASSRKRAQSNSLNYMHQDPETGELRNVSFAIVPGGRELPAAAHSDGNIDSSATIGASGDVRPVDSTELPASEPYNVRDIVATISAESGPGRKASWTNKVDSHSSDSSDISSSVKIIVYRHSTWGNDGQYLSSQGSSDDSSFDSEMWQQLNGVENCRSNLNSEDDDSSQHTNKKDDHMSETARDQVLLSNESGARVYDRNASDETNLESDDIVQIVSEHNSEGEVDGHSSSESGENIYLKSGAVEELNVLFSDYAAQTADEDEVTIYDSRYGNRQPAEHVSNDSESHLEMMEDYVSSSSTDQSLEKSNARNDFDWLSLINGEYDEWSDDD